MVNKIIQIIKILGIGVNELIIDIELDSITINSIEWIQSSNKVVVHIFDEDYDIEMDFDDLSDENQLIILTTLSALIYN